MQMGLRSKFVRLTMLRKFCYNLDTFWHVCIPKAFSEDDVVVHAEKMIL